MNCRRSRRGCRSTTLTGQEHWQRGPLWRHETAITNESLWFEQSTVLSPLLLEPGHRPSDEHHPEARGVSSSGARGVSNRGARVDSSTRCRAPIYLCVLLAAPHLSPFLTSVPSGRTSSSSASFKSKGTGGCSRRPSCIVAFR